MMMLTIAGNLGRDAELRGTNNGDSVCSFSVACDVGFGDKKKTNWVKCTLWGERAEKLSAHLTKGTKVVVAGGADLQEWRTKDGEPRKDLIIPMVDMLKFMGGGTQNDEMPASPAENPSEGDTELEDSIPF